MTRKTGRVSAVVLGLISGIIHCIVGLIVALFLIVTPLVLGSISSGGIDFDFFGSPALTGDMEFGILIIIGIALFLIVLINLIGACIVRKSRIAGGVMMLISSLPIIMIAVGSITTIWYFAVTGLVSFAAAILAFVPYSDDYIRQYAERKQRKNAAKQPYQPYQQYQPYQPQQQQYQPYQPQQQQQYQPYQPQQQPQQYKPYQPPQQQEPQQPQQAPPTTPEDNDAK